MSARLFCCSAGMKIRNHYKSSEHILWSASSKTSFAILIHRLPSLRGRWEGLSQVSLIRFYMFVFVSEGLWRLIPQTRDSSINHRAIRELHGQGSAGLGRAGLGWSRRLCLSITLSPTPPHPTHFGGQHNELVNICRGWLQSGLVLMKVSLRRAGREIPKGTGGHWPPTHRRAILWLASGLSIFIMIHSLVRMSETFVFFCPLQHFILVLFLSWISLCLGY